MKENLYTKPDSDWFTENIKKPGVEHGYKNFIEKIISPVENGEKISQEKLQQAYNSFANLAKKWEPAHNIDEVLQNLAGVLFQDNKLAPQEQLQWVNGLTYLSQDAYAELDNRISKLLALPRQKFHSETSVPTRRHQKQGSETRLYEKIGRMFDNDLQPLAQVAWRQFSSQKA